MPSASSKTTPWYKSIDISKMSEIYMQALVTISAARAARAGDGFLQPRHAPEESFKIPFLCQDGRLGSVMLWHSRKAEWHEPIDERGWTLQESLLSPRLLEFGTNQTRWRCRGNDSLREAADGWTANKV